MRNGVSAMAVGLLAAAFLCSAGAGPAHAQQQFFFSFEGQFTSSSAEQDFSLIIPDVNSVDDDVFFRTYHHDGGVNGAGAIIPGGSFDPILELFNLSGNTSFGVNDDYDAPKRDSLLTWDSVFFVPNPLGAHTPLTDPLPSGFYRLNLRPFSATATGAWAVDILTDAGIEVTDLPVNPGSTISSLKFGYNGMGSTIPRVQNIGLDGVDDTITGVLIVGATGRGRYEVQADGVTSVGGLTTVNDGSTLRSYNNGTFNANGGVLLNGGTLDVNTGGTFLLASGQDLNANSEAQIMFDAAYSLGGGSQISLESGADMDVSGPLSLGNNVTGRGDVTVDGAGSSLTANGVSMGFAGADSDLTFTNAAQGDLGNVTVTVDFLTSGTSTVFVGSDSDVTTDDLTIGTAQSTAATGFVSVTGTGSTLTQNGASDLTVGSADSDNFAGGSLSVTDNAEFTTGTGIITISKTGSLNINTGGVFNANADVTVGGGSITTNGAGDAFNLLGGGTLAASNNAQISFNGPRYTLAGGRTFNIESGSNFVTASGLDIGNTNTGTLIVDGAGSMLDVNGGSAFLGHFGGTADVTFRNQASADFDGEILLATLGNGSTGTITIESGATLSVRDVRLAADTFGPTSGTTAQLTVTGAGSMLAQAGATAMSIGGTGTGSSATVNIVDGGTLHAATATIGQTGIVNLNSDALLTASTINHTSGGQFNFAGGTLSVGTFDGTLDQAGGTLAPGTSPGLTHITGEYNLNAGDLEIEIAGPADFDQVRVDGAANLLGNLTLQLIGDYLPAPGTAFQIVDAATVVGPFANDQGGRIHLGVSYSFAITYLPGSVLLDDFAILIPGDADGDGDVDGDDFNAWGGNFPTASGATLAQGDFDGDGDVDGDDFNIWGGSFPSPGPGAASAVSEVPEPTTLVLLAPVAAALLRRRT